MALVVEGKMPACCGLCCECLGGGSDAYYCNRAKRQISEVVPPYDKRMEWCPILGELPDKYGRLIDADELMKKVRQEADFPSYEWCKAIECLEDASTVLEASK